MTQNNNDFAAKLAAIRLSYVTDALPEQVRAVRVSADQFEKATLGRLGIEALSVLHAASHKLAGSSGTFGLAELSVEARALSDFTDTKGDINENNFASFKEQIGVMADAVFQAAELSDKDQ